MNVFFVSKKKCFIRKTTKEICNKGKNMNQKEQLKLAGEQIDELFKMNEDLIKKLATNTIYFYFSAIVNIILTIILIWKM